ncbi:hypothetical protein MHF_0598 [Mycoplasma haemofelis Ohio2]|uniref:Uncharacterized protein n=1 Tax=Mycoplasma haemofelis (strain Ohio2) TaxID=859194 RepID=F6FI22_MYCHI|nr:hypothetical protein MHF_0598 [Mycoplasma haemofelis Ohio2]
MMETAGSAASPIIEPISEGLKKLTDKLDNFSKQGYNKGVDLKDWVDSNLSKSRIKAGWKAIQKNIKEWAETAGDISKSAYEKAGGFLKDWDESRTTLHTLFKALGGSFSIVGSLFGTWDTTGESKLMLLWEVLQNKDFPKFLNSASALASKNPKLLSELQGGDIPDILNAFKQDSDHVISTIDNLAKETETVTRVKLMSSLKLLSVLGKAKALQSRVAALLGNTNRNAEEIKEVKQLLTQTINELESVIKANDVKEE